MTEHVAATCLYMPLCRAKVQLIEEFAADRCIETFKVMKARRTRDEVSRTQNEYDALATHAFRWPL
jgi:hypothetical protein